MSARGPCPIPSGVGGVGQDSTPVVCSGAGDGGCVRGSADAGETGKGSEMSLSRCPVVPRPALRPPKVVGPFSSFVGEQGGVVVEPRSVGPATSEGAASSFDSGTLCLPPKCRFSRLAPRCACPLEVHRRLWCVRRTLYVYSWCVVCVHVCIVCVCGVCSRVCGPWCVWCGFTCVVRVMCVVCSCVWAVLCVVCVHVCVRCVMCGCVHVCVVRVWCGFTCVWFVLCVWCVHVCVWVVLCVVVFTCVWSV